MDYCQIRSIPIVKVQISCGIGMGLSHIIPIVDPILNAMDNKKLTASVF